MPTQALRQSENYLVAYFRQFNRFYTSLIGTLSRSYLDTPYSLQEARVIFEVANRQGCTARDIQLHSSFDQGYVSRLIERLSRVGLIRRMRSADDGRAQNLFLTSKGKRAFNLLNERANSQARKLVAGLSEDQMVQLWGALGIVRRLLDSEAPADPIRILEQRVGDLGWVFYRQAKAYRDEFAYNPAFEFHVCEGLLPFLKKYQRKKDRLWMAMAGAQPVGFIAVHHVTGRPRWAQLRWFFVERDFRSRGVGSRLLKRALAFCKKAGYEGVFLWTVNDLDSARRLYQKAGFQVTKELEGCAWASWAREQRWDLRIHEKETRPMRVTPDSWYR